MKRVPPVEVPIRSRDYWFKPLDNQQINWSLVDDNEAGGCTAYFFGNESGVFDRITFPSTAAADSALRVNGFHRIAECQDLDQKLVPPPPFCETEHWNGPIYSSGRFWRSVPADT